DLEIAAPHAPVECERLALEVIQLPPLDPSQPLRGVKIEEQGQVRKDTAGRADVELADEIGIDTAALALVGDGRVGVAVAEDDATACEPRADLFRDVLLACGHEQEHLDER